MVYLAFSVVCNKTSGQRVQSLIIGFIIGLNLFCRQNANIGINQCIQGIWNQQPQKENYQTTSSLLVFHPQDLSIKLWYFIKTKKWKIFYIYKSHRVNFMWQQNCCEWKQLLCRLLLSNFHSFKAYLTWGQMGTNGLCFSMRSTSWYHLDLRCTAKFSLSCIFPVHVIKVSKAHSAPLRKGSFVTLCTVWTSFGQWHFGTSSLQLTGHISALATSSLFWAISAHF